MRNDALQIQIGRVTRATLRDGSPVSRYLYIDLWNG